MINSVKMARGFTLIELVVVIIILGILAVVAAPKFINLQTDARTSTLNGLKGAIQGANTITYSKAAINGVQDVGDAVASDSGTSRVDIGTGTDAKLNFGYLQSTDVELINAMDISLDTDPSNSADWYIELGEDGAKTAKLFQAGSPYIADDTKECFLEYTPAAAADQIPTYVVKASGC
ncbi:prepilin-type N-terminal cleavage/methylation domain-containing protein [Shewanella sp. WXL01]|uniref:pilus assembly FimT family protein n=1 Tax=Shewanella sp. WXL01 TaxID=2709721 RepID=UPI0014385F39|nr:prepilin-type N-terminal cleavage/methylation domain-containing protein [Shewanella sp. WXL01]NKF52349.1 prepilin-type N-terminal cleavage/methylation domain-containing protein [Shewanella sp. WXL01]